MTTSGFPARSLVPGQPSQFHVTPALVPLRLPRAPACPRLASLLHLVHHCLLEASQRSRSATSPPVVSPRCAAGVLAGLLAHSLASRPVATEVSLGTQPMRLLSLLSPRSPGVRGRGRAGSEQPGCCSPQSSKGRLGQGTSPGFLLWSRARWDCLVFFPAPSCCPQGRTERTKALSALAWAAVT